MQYYEHFRPVRAWGIYMSLAGADWPPSRVTCSAEHVSDSLLETDSSIERPLSWHHHQLWIERERDLIKAKRIYGLLQGGSVRVLSWPVLASTTLGLCQKHNPVDMKCWPRTTSWFHKKVQRPHVKASRPFSSKCWSCVIYKRRNDRSLWSGYRHGEWATDSCLSYIYKSFRQTKAFIHYKSSDNPYGIALTL